MANNQALTRRTSRQKANIGVSEPSHAAGQSYLLRGPTRVTQDYVTPNRGSISGYQTFQLVVGDAAYRAITWAVQCTAAIAGKTYTIAGVHYLSVDAMAEYIDHVELKASGNRLQDWTIEELVNLNKYHDISFGTVYTGFAFPGEFMFSREDMTDVFALGTENMRDLYVNIRPNKTTFDPATMEIVVMPHVVSRVKNAGFTFKNERFSETFSGTGNHSFWDLPIDDDVRFIWIKGDGISHLKLEVNKTTLLEVDRAQYESYLIEKRRDVTALNGGWLIDMFAERIPRALGALESKVERQIDARYKLELTMTNALTPVEFIVMNADLMGRMT